MDSNNWGYGGKRKQMTGFKNNTYEEPMTVKDVQKLPFLAIPDRGISQEVCEILGIRTELDTSDGETQKAWYFPSYNQKGKIVGYKRKDALTESKEKNHYRAIGSVSPSNQLFGQPQAGEGQRTKENYNLIFVEGEFDVASIYEVQYQRTKDTRWEGVIKPNVVGLQCGTAHAVESTTHNEDFIRRFDNVVLAFDGDEATPLERMKGIKRGKEAKEDVASCLLTDNLLEVEYEGKFKDASDYLQEGLDQELVNLFRNKTKKYVAEKISDVEDIGIECILASKPEGVVIDCMPLLMKKLKFNKGELGVVTAPSGVGKSSVVKAIGDGLMKQSYRLGGIFLEETKEETLKHFIASELNINPKKFIEDPLAYASEEEIGKVYNNFVKSGKLCFVDHFGSIPLNSLMNIIKQLVYIKKVDFILLDHLSMVVSGSEGDDRKQLDMLMTELAAFVAANDVGIIAVSHIKRTDEQPPKQKEGEETPWWTTCRKEQLRGSAALEQLAWWVIGIEAEQMPDRSRGRIRLVALKNRTYRHLGVADVLMMNEETGVLEDAGDEEIQI